MNHGHAEKVHPLKLRFAEGGVYVWEGGGVGEQCTLDQHRHPCYM